MHKERLFALPISRKQTAYLRVPSNLTVADWDQILAIINAMKPGILLDNHAELTAPTGDDV